MKKMYRIICQFTNQTKFVPEIVPLWLKNRNQRVHTGGLIRGEAYTWSNTSVKEKVAYLWGPIRGRAYRRRSTVNKAKL